MDRFGRGDHGGADADCRGKHHGDRRSKSRIHARLCRAVWQPAGQLFTRSRSHRRARDRVVGRLQPRRAAPGLLRRPRVRAFLRRVSGSRSGDRRQHAGRRHWRMG